MEPSTDSVRPARQQTLQDTANATDLLYHFEVMWAEVVIVAASVEAGFWLAGIRSTSRRDFPRGPEGESARRIFARLVEVKQYRLRLHARQPASGTEWRSGPMQLDAG